MRQVELDFTKAAVRRDRGIAAVTGSNLSWMDHALTTLESWARLHAEVTIEDFRAWWAEHGGPEPTSANVWGAVAQMATRRGLLERTGYRPAKSVKTHGPPVAVYRSRVFVT